MQDEQLISHIGNTLTFQFQAWLQPASWSNPRGGNTFNTLAMKSAYAVNASAGNANVCVVAHLDNMDGPSVGLTCATNGVVTGSLFPYDDRVKYIFAMNNSSTARTIKGGWYDCADSTPRC